MFDGVGRFGPGEPVIDEPLLTVDATAQGEVFIVTIGEVDLLTVPRLRAALGLALDRAAGGPVVLTGAS